MSFLVAAVTVVAVRYYLPFPKNDPFLELIGAERPHIFSVFKAIYVALSFTSPYIVTSTVLSLVYIFIVRRDGGAIRGRLPRYVDPTERDELYLVLGEIHHPKKPIPVEHPHWLRIPRRGLFTGLAIFGATGTGKTSCGMVPFAEQILAYQAGDPERRISGLVLEVKGDFCHKVNQILTRHGRAEDYVEMSLASEYRYNPLHNDLEAYALAYGIASLLNNLFGKGKEPFWQQAYTNLVKFIILLHKVVYDYVTLFDVYECAINPDLLEKRIEEGRHLFRETTYLMIHPEAFLHHHHLEDLPFEMDPESNRLKAVLTEDLVHQLERRGIPYEIQTETGGSTEAVEVDRQDQFAAVERWFYHDWMRIEPKLRTSIVEGISVFLSLFDDNPAVKRTFCPPKECYNLEKNHDGRYGKPLPPFSELIEQGKVCALNFHVSANPGLARAIGTFLKQDFQRAVLDRIPKMEHEKEKQWREVLFLCDEYHSFATVGESDPTGDEKFFSLSRQARCIPIVATQSISSLRSTLPGESWRTLLQTFRTKIFLALSDDFSTRVASELCGKEEQLRLHYNLSEHGQDARVSVLTGRTTSHKSSVSASKSYSVVRDAVFEPKIFAELRNAQSIVLAYDGFNPHPPSYCYLKPYFRDRNISYFEQLEREGTG